MATIDKRAGHFRSARLRKWLLLVTSLMVLLWPGFSETGFAHADDDPSTVLSPVWVGGTSAQDDQRDVDFYPSPAFDPINNRYLVVWLSARNADSSSDGLDVYGKFLDSAGQPVGNEFRITDSNTAARSAQPAVVAGDGEFVVVWTRRGSSCQLYMQRVTDTAFRSDQALITGSGQYHSPTLVYSETSHRYALAYVEGDDYSPPTLFSSQTADCGNSASSASRIKALDFYLAGEHPVVGSTCDVSDVPGGSFRPRMAYGADLNQYVVAWEDRRDAGAQANRFDVYFQRLDGTLEMLGPNIAAAAGDDYTNQDSSAIWTPRPVVAAGSDRFLITWFAHETSDDVHLWSVVGRLIGESGGPSTPFSVAQMTFAQSHSEHAPTGFLAATFIGPAREFLVGFSSHLESIWGYLSLVLVQRVTLQGELLRLDGTVRSQPGVGSSVDYANDDQIGIGMAVNPYAGAENADCLITYSRHMSGQHAKDFDIWDVRVQSTTEASEQSYLPRISK